jgi:GT2 family glycosyltransferase
MTGDELAVILAGGDASAYPAWARFDPVFYRAANPTLGVPGGEPARDALLRHYLQVGRHQGLSPNRWFDEEWYLAQNPEVAETVAAGRHGIQSGFEHYLLLGHAGLSPHWLYDEALYREQVSEFAVAAMGDANFYDHYLRSGARRGLRAHALFDPGFYTATGAVPDRDLPAEGAFGHYLTRLWKDGTEGWTSPLFDLTASRLDPACRDAIAEGRSLGALHHALRNAASNSGAIRSFPSSLADALRKSLAAQVDTTGGIDIAALHEGAGGWFIAGWLAAPASTKEAAEDAGPEAPKLRAGTPALIALRHADGTHAARAPIALFRRDDLTGQGDGFLAFVPGAEGMPAGAIQRLDLVTETAAWQIAIPAKLRSPPAAQLTSTLADLVARLDPASDIAAFRRLLAHPIPDGGNTLQTLPERIFLEVDEAIRLPSGDLVLVGWHLARPGAVRAIRLRRGWRTRTLRLDQGVAIERPDVRNAAGRESGLLNLRCGFMLRVPRVFTPDETGGPAPYLEVEMESGAIAQRGFAIGQRTGLEAIRFLLDRTDPPYGDAASPYDRVVGPAVASLQASRMANTPIPHRLDFGAAPAAPRVSVIVTLYGRIDFLDFQLGIEAAQRSSRRDQATAPMQAIERLYVLDDPPRARAAETLAVQAHLRFGLSFSLLTQPENRGFAGANNAGLRAARGDYVCFLNSDVFPGTPDWVERLAARLDADPTLGAVAPRLLYEDGSIQHDGMVFRRIPRMGAWRFPDHPGKGMRPDAGHGMLGVVAATGACLMMRRDLALALGGFDEAYPVGDFEDADLCMKLRAMGLSIAVDRDVTLFHLERQSQAGSAEHWRMQLTLFNAWQHEQRWHRLLDRPAPTQAPARADAA